VKGGKRMRFPGFSVYVSFGERWPRKSKKWGVFEFHIKERYIRFGFLFFVVWIAALDLDLMLAALLKDFDDHVKEGKNGKNT
jgi:hypothetical protein